MEKGIDFTNTPICQSCGMPLTSPEQFGKTPTARQTAITASTAARTAKPTCAAHWMK